MRFESSLNQLQKAIKDFEKSSKKAAKKKMAAVSNNQIDMFAAPVPSNDVDVDMLKKQLDEAISSIENVMKEAS